MQLAFELDSGVLLPFRLDHLVIAGWAGRDLHAIEHHIQELAAIGVPRPSAVPLFYRVADTLATQSSALQALGEESSGEAEAFLFATRGQLFVGVGSDHTDRRLEASGVAQSKQICAKPVGRSAWRFDEVEPHWDEIILRSHVIEGGERRLYQEGSMRSLRHPRDLMAMLTGGAHQLPDGTGMFCGTIGVIGGIRPSRGFIIELFDPVLQRTLTHEYAIEPLAVVA